ncbi:MAG TPA: heavy-metal-associated domain-containing protein, partial [Candidatus Latescibacteria bacterium]|nr:heavy-metal-associated domain-containing protein [Candidatus Latescibacterota bacterium]
MSTKFSLPVKGMTCASCAARVERALKDVEGVAEAKVNLATERAVVEYDPEVLDIASLVRAVRDTGYDVPVETVVLPIGGMTCASCAAHVEKALKGVEGVLSATVNLATE